MHAEDIYFEQFRKWAFSFPPPWIYPIDGTPPTKIDNQVARDIKMSLERPREG